MLKNYLKTAIRNILKTGLFSSINIFGLSIGMSACLFILYYVNYEKSYDKFHENSSRIYRVRYERSDLGGESARFASCCPPAGLRIREKLPEVEKVARIFKFIASVSYGENRFIEERLFFTEPDFLDIFKLQFIKYDKSTGFHEPNRALISRNTAIKYFGDSEPIGKIISVDKKTDYVIMGVYEDMPGNSHIKFDILLSYPNLLAMFGNDVENSWGDTGWFTYILLKPGIDPAVLEKKLPSIIDQEFVQVLKEYNLTMDLKLQKLTDIHLTSHYMQEFEPNGDLDIVNFLSIIAIFIIIIAWVNYINLSTSRSMTRAKEVGLRKTLGASRKQLLIQFFIETVIINFIAVLLTLILLQIFIPAFLNITSISTTYSIWSLGWFWLAIPLIFFSGIFLSGLYPVFVLASFSPMAALRNKYRNPSKGIGLRKTLVLFQFTIAFFLITGTVAVFQQLAFMKTENLGFTADQKLVVRSPRVRDANFPGKLETFKNKILSISGINKFCVATEVPGKQILWDAGGIRRVGSDENKNYQIVGIDYNYVDMYGLNLVAGRNFSKEFPSDTSALILNETAAKWLGFKNPEEAIRGQVIYWDKTYTVAGVLKDYHQQSVKAAFEPHIFRFMPYGRGARGVFVFEINSNNINSRVKEIKSLYSEFFPDNPFDYFFQDEYYNRQYQSDEIFGKVFAVFSFLSIFVTSLGVLGLSAFVISRRTKEIGIRKALGADIKNIFLLLTKDFLLLIFISSVAAIPFSFYGIHYWLQSFAKRIDLNAFLYVIPLLIIIFITISTILYHVLRAARKNPVDSLRYE